MTFNENPEAYHKYRPIYPEELIKDLIALSMIKEGDKIIEVGCGTGKATGQFSKYNFNITGIEIGRALAEFASELFRQYPNFKIENNSFEDWDSQGEKFELLISAQAFHWIDPKVKYLKASSVLKENGSMGLFWNFYDENKSDFLKEYDEIYKTIVPNYNESEKKTLEQWVQELKQEIEESELFKYVTVKHYKWETQYSEEHFINLLNTYSDFYLLEDSIKEKIYNEIHDLFIKYGKMINLRYHTVLVFVKIR